MQTDISDLVIFRSNTKSSDLIAKVGTLKIKKFGMWDPQEEFSDYDIKDNSEQKHNIKHPYDKILAAGKRPAWEMENILPGYDPDDIDCPIGEGIDLFESGDLTGAIRHMKGLLKMDDRCLDAYAHLGNWYYEYGNASEFNKAKNFYKTGVAIGFKSISNKQNDIFPWGLVRAKANKGVFRSLANVSDGAGQGVWLKNLIRTIMYLTDSSTASI